MCVRINTSVFPATGGGGPSTPRRFKYYPRRSASWQLPFGGWFKFTVLPLWNTDIYCHACRRSQRVFHSVVGFFYSSPVTVFSVPETDRIAPLGALLSFRSTSGGGAFAGTLFSGFCPHLWTLQKKIPLIYSNFILFIFWIFRNYKNR